MLQSGRDVVHVIDIRNDCTHLIHILAKQETHMKDSITVLGRVPAKLSTRVMMIRSMFVLLNALESVKPPRRSMIVGENMWAKTNLPKEISLHS